jgi:hypothetical protein
MAKAHIDYYVSRFSGNGIEIRYEDLREAFNFAKVVASQDEFKTALLRKIEWNDKGRIVKYEGCKVFPNGKFEYLYRK